MSSEEPERQLFESYAEHLERRLAEPRSGDTGWSRMVPELTYGRHRVPPPADARRAAVLVLFYPHHGEWCIPLMERTSDTTVHSGQVCFPGGALESQETPEQGALRELEEELGVSPLAVRLCGRLTAMYVFASNFLVTPCVAVSASPPVFHANPGEVAAILEVPFHVLKDPQKIGRHQIQRRGLMFEAPHFEFLGRQIWGATSMMLAELLTRLS